MTRAHELARWLSSLEPAACDAVIAKAHVLALPPETGVYAQGDPVDGIYIVLEGAVKELAAFEGCLRLVRLTGPVRCSEPESSSASRFKLCRR
uniref:Cyclic nucleotide-binding domain-containing protein n=1 Tax=Acetithermum autotrophicum TaxID=1446466 RepID=H5STW5_ACEAU|nr:hypothetical protein HGMM_OP4C601 [Candidatus Acetothermum autotrophicum]